MGNFRSRYDNQKAALRSAQIDRQIEQDANKTKYNCKILLLGTFDPSTFRVPRRRLTSAT